MKRIAILSAVEALAKHEELAITHLPPLYSTPTFGPERGEDKPGLVIDDIRESRNFVSEMAR
jgi:hypothetical protein